MLYCPLKGENLQKLAFFLFSIYFTNVSGISTWQQRREPRILYLSSHININQPFPTFDQNYGEKTKIQFTISKKKKKKRP